MKQMKNDEYIGDRSSVEERKDIDSPSTIRIIQICISPVSSRLIDPLG